MRVIVTYNHFEQNPTCQGDNVALAFEAPVFNGPASSFSGWACVSVDATPREVEKAVVDSIIATAAIDNIVVRGRDILLPALTLG